MSENESRLEAAPADDAITSILSPPPDPLVIATLGDEPKAPAWIRTAAAVRLVELEGDGAPLDGSFFVLDQLVTHGLTREAEDRTCDRCGECVPTTSPALSTFLYRPERHIGLIGALCQRCALAVPTERRVA